MNSERSTTRYMKFPPNFLRPERIKIIRHQVTQVMEKTISICVIQRKLLESKTCCPCHQHWRRSDVRIGNIQTSAECPQKQANVEIAYILLYVIIELHQKWRKQKCKRVFSFYPGKLVYNFFPATHICARSTHVYETRRLSKTIFFYIVNKSGPPPQLLPTPLTIYGLNCYKS